MIKLYIDRLVRINATNYLHPRSSSPARDWLSPFRSRVDYYALVLVKKGSITLIYNGQEVVLSEQDIFLVRPGSKYQFKIPFQDREVENELIKFRYPPEDFPLRDGVYSISEAPHLKPRIEQIVMEHKFKHVMFKDRQRAILGDVLIELHRIGSRGQGTAGRVSPVIARSITRIHANLGRRFDIRSLAQEAGYTVPYFSLKFKQETGLSPKKYLMGFKIRLAKDLLLTTNLNMGQISQRLGFTDVFDFSRYFRKTVGIAPTAFRKSRA